MTALQAIKERDSAALMDAFADVAAANDFRLLVLPEQSADDCRWFWQQVMTPEQLEATLNAVRDVCLGIAREMDFEPGVHFSLGSSNDLPTMICPAHLAQVFYKKLPRERHSVLRFYLQIAG